MIRSKKLRALLWTMGLCALALLSLRTFVADLYWITSSSMAPILRPGQVALVQYDRSPLRRHELAVFADGEQAVVKRAVGLPHERVHVDAAGKIWINGERLEPLPIFDDRRPGGGSRVERVARGEVGWHPGDGGLLELDARGLPSGSTAAALELLERPLEGEVILEGSFRAVSPGGRLDFHLSEGDADYRFSLELLATGSAAARLSRLWGPYAADEEVLASAELPFLPGEWKRVRLTNLDGGLRVDVGEAQPALSAACARPEGRSTTDRLAIGGEGCRIELRELGVWHDPSYVSSGRFAVGRPLYLGEDEYFLLGDNSSSSTDSRAHGPVHRERIFGRVLWVVWPPDAIGPIEDGETR